MGTEGPHRLADRILGLQPEDRGSIPLGAIKDMPILG